MATARISKTKLLTMTMQEMELCAKECFCWTLMKYGVGVPSVLLVDSVVVIKLLVGFGESTGCFNAIDVAVPERLPGDPTRPRWGCCLF